MQLFRSGDALFLRHWPYAWALLQQDGGPDAGRVGVPSLTGGMERQPTAAVAGEPCRLAAQALAGHPLPQWLDVGWAIESALVLDAHSGERLRRTQPAWSRDLIRSVQE